MPSFKWLFRLAVVLSFAWIAFSRSQPADAPGDGTPRSPETAFDAVRSKLTSLQTTLREKAMSSIVAELRSRGIPIEGDSTSTSLESLSALAKSAISSARTQLAQNPGQNNSNLQSLLKQVSDLDGQQVMSQLQAKARRLIEETGSPNAERESSTVQD